MIEKYKKILGEYKQLIDLYQPVLDEILHEFQILRDEEKQTQKVNPNYPTSLIRQFMLETDNILEAERKFGYSITEVRFQAVMIEGGRVFDEVKVEEIKTTNKLEKMINGMSKEQIEELKKFLK
jgi:hypothetical protein